MNDTTDEPCAFPGCIYVAVPGEQWCAQHPEGKEHKPDCGLALGLCNCFEAAP